jgi:hypothetical protein
MKDKGGKLRLMYEANPMAMIVEAAGARHPPVASASSMSSRPSCISGCRSFSVRRMRSSGSSRTTEA